jgi:hypothetical protein
VVLALYFYGSILLRALKSKITVILTYAQKRHCVSSNYLKVLFYRLTIINITKCAIKIFEKVLFCCQKPNFKNLSRCKTETLNIKVVNN